MAIERKVRMKPVIDCLIITMFILTCGTQFFSNFHASQTYLVLLLSVLIFIYFQKHLVVKKKNLKVALTIILIFFTVSMFNFDVRFYNNIIIFMIKFTTLCILCSNMEKKDFEYYYINVIIIELFISLICFFICTFSDASLLPGYYEQKIDYQYQGNSGYNIIYLTPYYTVGWLSTGGFFKRNAGMFGEPGVHAVMLNIALLFVFSGHLDDKLSIRKRKIIIGFLIIGVITTKSTGGFISLLLIFIYVMTKKMTVKSLKRDIPIAIGISIITILVAIYGSTFDKLINRSGSFITRSNDTISGFGLALKHFWVGCGIFTDISKVLEEYGIFNISNGIVEMMIRFGIPLAMVILFMLYKGIKRYFDAKGVALFSICMLFMLVLSTEPVTWHLLIMSFLFCWRDSNKQINKGN